MRETDAVFNPHYGVSLPAAATILSVARARRIDMTLRAVENDPVTVYCFAMTLAPLAPHTHLALPPPALATYAQKPSWLNRAGRIDRSACIELRASDIWRLVSEADWRACMARRTGHARQHTRSPRPHPEAFALFTVVAKLLAELHDTRSPLQLAGDFRTIKSNAMKTHYRDRRTPIARNPNRGGMRTKKLGVWSGCEAGDADTPRLCTGWTQVIRIERWRLHKNLAQHFLICPCCQRKHLKLFMPLAAPKEIDDARVAEGWVKILDARQIAGRVSLDRESIALRARLIERYGPIFRTAGRELRCRRCLGLRYGQVKWPRLRRREAMLQAQSQRERANEDASKQAEREAEQAALDERMANAIGERALRIANRQVQISRLQHARKARANQLRRERKEARAAGILLPDRRRNIPWLRKFSRLRFGTSSCRQRTKCLRGIRGPRCSSQQASLNAPAGDCVKLTKASTQRDEDPHAKTSGVL